jgi:hypothetical protein
MKYKTRRRSHYIFIALLFFICFFFDYGYVTKAHIFTAQELMPFRGVNFAPEHLPAGIDMDKIDKGVENSRALPVKGEGEAKIIKWGSAERIIEIIAYEPLILRIRTFNFPGWKAYIDTQQRDIHTEKDTGAMLIDVAEGKHTLVLRFEDTPVRYYSKVISLVSLVIIALLVFITKKTNHGKSSMLSDKNE